MFRIHAALSLYRDVRGKRTSHEMKVAPEKSSVFFSICEEKKEKKGGNVEHFVRESESCARAYFKREKSLFGFSSQNVPRPHGS